jgi:FimV-like protein
MQTLSFSAMASTCHIQLDIADDQDTQSIFDQVQAEVLRIQNKYSRYLPDSVVSQINTQAGQTPYECDAETAALIEFAHRLHAQYQGVFELTTGVLRQVDFPLDEESATMSEVGTKLDLARAYIDMGDPEGARSILDEVLKEGGAVQKQEAERLMASLP